MRRSRFTFWDMFGKDGHPVRRPPRGNGPLLLSACLELSVRPRRNLLNIAFQDLPTRQGLAYAISRTYRPYLSWAKVKRESRAKLCGMAISRSPLSWAHSSAAL